MSNLPSRCYGHWEGLGLPTVTRRGGHYENEAKNQRIMLKNRTRTPDRQIPLEPWHCDYGEHNEFATIQSYRTYVSPEDIWEKYVPMGFTNFKLEGRTAFTRISHRLLSSIFANSSKRLLKL